MEWENLNPNDIDRNEVIDQDVEDQILDLEDNINKFRVEVIDVENESK